MLTQISKPKSEEERLSLLERASLLERTAHQLREEQKISEAFDVFDRAASLYRQSGEHLKAAFCYASAATAWNLRSGLQPLHQAALRNYWAAREALQAKDYDYARTLFRDAALLFEKEGDAENYSTCFLESQHADRKRAWAIFANARHEPTMDPPLPASLRERGMALYRWFLNCLGDFLWGYGERPSRSCAVASLVIAGCALIYHLASFSGLILAEGASRPVRWTEALYMSIITFATVGYGDFLPLGWVRMLASFEALMGIFLMPLFLITLSRRYLRMYR